MKVGIFTICIGESYRKNYELVFKSSVEKYCEKYGYDLNVLTDFIGDEKYRNNSYISFMKMIVPYSEKAKEYDLIMVLDADIIVNIDSPSFHNIDFNNKIGIVDEYQQPSYEKRLEIQKENGWEISASEYYKLCNLDIDTQKLFNSGMFICQPKIHGYFFKNLVEIYINNQLNHYRGFHYEQSVFGYELQKNNLYYIMDSKWNNIWFFYKNKESNDIFLDYFNFVKNSYFVHMTGYTDYKLAYQLNNV
jgi:hypothetical protein